MYFCAKIVNMRRFSKICLLALVLWGVALVVEAKQVWSADNIPIPYLGDSTQYVSDPDGYMPRAMRDSANHYLARLNRECGVQNVLIIVGRVREADPFRMAQDVGNKYGIGYKGSRRGLVVVISVEDRKYFVAPGMGLEGELTDVDCDDIARACIVANMKRGQPAEAVVAFSRAIYNKVKSGRTGIARIDDGPVNDAEDWLLVISLLVLIFGIPVFLLVRYVLQECGVIKKSPRRDSASRRKDDGNDWFPPFFLGGGGGFGGSSGGGFSGGSFGGGSFGGGGSGGSW